MLSKDINKLIASAMKARDEIRVSTLRLLLSAFNYERIEKQHELTDGEEEIVIRKEAKKRRDAIEAYKKAGADDRAQKEQKELEILQEFLPLEMSEEELEKLVDEAIKEMGLPASATPQALQAGKVIGMVKEKAPTADGARIAEIVKNKLSG